LRDEAGGPAGRTPQSGLHPQHDTPKPCQVIGNYCDAVLSGGPVTSVACWHSSG
jgi:hypothetical protein